MVGPPKIDDRLRKKLPELWANTEITVDDIGRRFSVSGSLIANLAARMNLGPKPAKLRMYRRKGVAKQRVG